MKKLVLLVIASLMLALNSNVYARKVKYIKYIVAGNLGHKRYQLNKCNKDFVVLYKIKYRVGSKKFIALCTNNEMKAKFYKNKLNKFISNNPEYHIISGGYPGWSGNKSFICPGRYAVYEGDSMLQCYNNLDAAIYAYGKE